MGSFCPKQKGSALQSQVFLSQLYSSEDCRYPDRSRKEELHSLHYFVTKLSTNNQECCLAESTSSALWNLHFAVFILQFCKISSPLSFASNLYLPPLSMSLPLFFHLAPYSASLLIPVPVFLTFPGSVLLSFSFISPQLSILFPFLIFYFLPSFSDSQFSFFHPLSQLLFLQTTGFSCLLHSLTSHDHPAEMWKNPNPLKLRRKTMRGRGLQPFSLRLVLPGIPFPRG